jgi:hypothetical protein
MHNKWAIPYGDKIKGVAMIPNAVMEDRKLAICCLRGLIDTDGSVSKDGNGIQSGLAHITRRLLIRWKTSANR